MARAPRSTTSCEWSLEPYLSAGPHRIRIEGAALRCGPKAATSLALVLHELATNAAKYGALSEPEGALEVSWTVEDGHRHPDLDGRQGGPAVKEPADQEGLRVPAGPSGRHGAARRKHRA